MEQSAVIKSKVDISRNLNGYSFPHKLSSQEAEIIIQKVKNVFSDSKYDFTLDKWIKSKWIRFARRKRINGWWIFNKCKWGTTF